MKNILIILVIVTIVVIIYLKRKPIMSAMGLTRGLKVNNPSNIVIQYNTDTKTGKKTKYLWKGEIDNATETLLKTFKDLNWGFRGAFINLDGYFRNGLNTIDKIINAYAPAGKFKDPISGKPLPENNPEIYKKFLENKLKLNRNVKLNWGDPDVKFNIIRAITKMEQGKDADEQALKRGYELFLNPNT